MLRTTSTRVDFVVLALPQRRLPLWRAGTRLPEVMRPTAKDQSTAAEALAHREFGLARPYAAA